MERQCDKISNNHSEDKILVWIGDEIPWILCGYHATQISNALIDKIRAEQIDYTPCDECDELVKTETHTEESGLCKDCAEGFYLIINN
jgi:formylmethanofuran dehydrogenase subunit E